jgi:predicted Ser/Thr protein kinase
MATVFLAEDERLGRQVAVKRLHADSPEDMARRFDREARLGASLNHPNLVMVFDTVVDPEGVLIVMEYVDGPSLSAALKSGALARDRALGVIREIAAALDQVHGQGIVHRDVKPANILLAERGQAKLADLGIAFAAEAATHITRTGTVLGTPSYMAPEQLEGREVGPAVDVYALATVAFEALSGRKARIGGTPLEIAHRIATESAPDLREAWAEAPEGASQVLCQGMAFDPADRTRSAGELAERLEAELGGGGRASTAATRRVGRGAAAAAAGGGAAAAGAAAAVPSHGESAEDVSTEGREEVAEHREESTEPAEDADASPAPADASPAPEHRPSPEPSSPGRARSRRPRPAWLAPVALLLVVGAATVAGVLALGGGTRGQTESGDPQVPAEPGGSNGAQGSAEAAAGDPAQTVTSFYQQAAAGDYEGAWALAGPGFRSQVGGFESFRGGVSTLESIEFEQAESAGAQGDSAEVQIRTVATHSDGVDRCQGLLDVTRDGANGWLIDRANVSCPDSTRG